MHSFSTLARSLCALSLVALAAAGCATQKAATMEGSSAMTDAQIAAIVVAANEIDIANGELAESKSNNPEVKKFAQRMMEDHRSVNQSAAELVKRLNVTPEESATSKSLKESAEATRDQMKAKEGTEFDMAYVDNEVAYHKAVLGMLDDTLVPAAQNAELKALLVSVRPAFVAHLEHAESIQKTLQGAQSSVGDHADHAGHH